MGNQNVGLIRTRKVFDCLSSKLKILHKRESPLSPKRASNYFFCPEIVLLFQGESDGIWAWTRFNQLFNYLPLAAMIEKKIICMHGGIGRSITSVEQIEKLERPITMDVGSIILMDLLWYA